jgi:hypothetical protein
VGTYLHFQNDGVVGVRKRGKIQPAGGALPLSLGQVEDLLLGR